MTTVEDYQSLRSELGFVELTGWTRIRITGRDRRAFLHNFCTNDVKRLSPGQSCEAFFTNVKGKIIGHGLVTCRDDELVIVGVPGQVPRLFEHLDRYIIREDVQIHDDSARCAMFLVAGGSRARDLVLALADIAISRAGLLQPLVNAAGRLGGLDVRWISWNLVGTATCGVLEGAAENAEQAAVNLRKHAAHCEWSAFDTLRIEAGTPLFGIDFDERNLPQEVGRDREAISFTKGCYLGQETVARIDALGHVNQRITGVRFHTPAVPQIGTELKCEDVLTGRITSAKISPRLHAPLALAMVRREYAAVGTRLESAAGMCEVVELPLAD
jgi:folate-binding protein YgfZ